MLSYKAWLDIRWRFLIGLAVLAILACGIVIDYPSVVRLLPAAAAIEPGDGVIGRAIQNAIEVQSDFRGYVWWQWHRQNLLQAWTILAALLGSGGLLASGRGGAALFTLSLPVSRRRVFGVRAASGLVALFVLAVLPSLLISLLSPTVSERYAVRDVLVHAVCLFTAGAVFFSVALALSTTFSDIWRPMFLACGAAVGLAILEQFVVTWPGVGVIRAMSGELYFRTGTLPWMGLVSSLAASAALLVLGARHFERRDF